MFKVLGHPARLAILQFKNADFIANYHLRLIEYRLSFSDTRINELVEEFGFADESHMNKFFKRHKGMSLSVYRRNYTSLL